MRWDELIVGSDLVENRTDYALDEKTMRFHQNHYLGEMLQRTQRTSRRALLSVLFWIRLC